MHVYRLQICDLMIAQVARILGQNHNQNPCTCQSFDQNTKMHLMKGSI